MKRGRNSTKRRVVNIDVDKAIGALKERGIKQSSVTNMLGRESKALKSRLEYGVYEEELKKIAVILDMEQEELCIGGAPEYVVADPPIPPRVREASLQTQLDQHQALLVEIITQLYRELGIMIDMEQIVNRVTPERGE